ncbi:MAG: SDR family NAD(P)-dependent oxidoreductase [Arhodomonas sp.]|nr:SDR family NAD(P)-dependent oxidoreductase [Arhodomonas sp.]
MADPVLLITGASSGIGAETARQAVADGYRLVLAARRRERLEALAEELGGPERVLTVRCDVTDESDQQAMVAAAMERFGRIDAVFANAGMKGSPGGFSGADTSVWREMILTNVYGVGLDPAPYPRRAAREPGPLAHHRFGGRSGDHPRFHVQRQQVGGERHRLRRARGAPGQRRPRHPHRARHGGHGVLRRAPEQALAPTDVAGAVVYALRQPRHVDVDEILVRPTPPEERDDE